MPTPSVLLQPRLKQIPLLDLAAQHESLQPALNEVWHETLANSGFIGGGDIGRFEREFADALGLGEVVACANGTDAIELVLDGLGIGPGDEVIVPAMTWISTAEAVATRGATPRFADVDATTNGLSASGVESAITPRTRAVIAVHLYGHPVDLPGISALCSANELHLIEDCAQAHGARLGGRPIGTWGIAATFSFFPSKNLGCLGDGGAVATPDAELAQRVRVMAGHGQQSRHVHTVHGRNSRLDALQARVLSLKLPHLDGWVDARNRVAERYTAAFQEIPHLTVPVHPSAQDRHAFHLYVIKTPQRDELAAVLAGAGIASAVHYPTALPLQPAYADQSLRAADFPEAVRIQNEALSLPLYPELEADDQDQVISVIQDFFAGS